MPGETPLAARGLERALVFNFVIHGVAMVSMALLLLPAIPGGGVEDVALRAARIAAHPWLFRLGWLPWQITAFADLWLAIALLRTAGVPRVAGWLTVIVTALAIVPDQIGQALWITRGVELAQRAAGDTTQVSAYLQFEQNAFYAIAGVGTVGYLLGALGWTWCLAAAGMWSRLLTCVSVAVWGIFGVAATLFFVPDRFKPNPIIIGGLNAIAFVLLEWWLLLALEQVARRARPFTRLGRLAEWHAVKRSFPLESIANSRAIRLLCERLPMPRMISDTRDLVYIHYVVNAERLQPLVPAGFELHRLGTQAMFTVLVYRHGNFGPAMFPRLRRRLGSPIQSNWRIYVTDSRTGQLGIHFITTTISKTLPALAARMLSEGVPMHVPAESILAFDGKRATVRLTAGKGSSPELVASLEVDADRTLPPLWAACFESYDAMLAYTIPQDRAYDTQPWRNSTTLQTFTLTFPDATTLPLRGKINSPFLDDLLGPVEALSFYVPAVRFQLVAEQRRAITGEPAALQMR